jgi:predicted RNA-binding protein YlxR (DUF448 family)
VATGTVCPVDDMIRFVAGPDDGVVPDLKRRLPGRGVWITGTRQALATAIARKAFARSFKRNVRVAPDLADTTERLLERAALDALAMTHKARLVAAGYSKVEAALAAKARIAGLIHAAEAAPDGVRKLNAALRNRTAGTSRVLAVITTFTSAQLDLALGRSNVVHAALLAGPEAETFMTRVARLDRFRTGGPISGTPAIGNNQTGTNEAGISAKRGRRPGRGGTVRPDRVASSAGHAGVRGLEL